MVVKTGRERQREGEGERQKLNDRDTAPSPIAALPPFPARDRDPRDPFNTVPPWRYQTCKMFGYWWACLAGLRQRTVLFTKFIWTTAIGYHSFGVCHIDNHRQFTPAWTQYFGGCGGVRRAD